MAKKLKISQGDAVAIFEALGFKTARKWSIDKLTTKLNEMTETPDEALDDDRLNEILDKLMEVDEAVVTPDEPEEEPDEDEDENGDEDEDEASEEGDEDEDEDEDEEKPKKKPKKKGKNKPKKKGAKEKSKKSRGPRENSIDNTTVELLKAKPMTLKGLVSALAKKFPDRDVEVLERTTKRRLTGYLQNKLGITIKKSDKGVYSIR